MGATEKQKKQESPENDLKAAAYLI